jgi:hypothetical protein
MLRELVNGTPVQSENARQDTDERHIVHGFAFPDSLNYSETSSSSPRREVGRGFCLRASPISETRPCEAVTLLLAGVSCKRDGTTQAPCIRCIASVTGRSSGAAEQRSIDADADEEGGPVSLGSHGFLLSANPLIKCPKAEEPLGRGDLPSHAEAKVYSPLHAGMLSHAPRRRRNADEAFSFEGNAAERAFFGITLCRGRTAREASHPILFHPIQCMASSLLSPCVPRLASPLFFCLCLPKLVVAPLRALGPGPCTSFRVRQPPGKP